MKEFILKVDGMVCNGCEARVVKAVGEMEGVEEVAANHEEGKVTVKTTQDNIHVIEEKIEDLGFSIVKE